MRLVCDRIFGRLDSFLHAARGLILPALIFGVQIYSPPALAGDGQIVDLELVLLVDASASVDDGEFDLQVKGLASALANPILLDAIEARIVDGIATVVIQWSDESSQRVAVEWSLIRNRGDAIWVASQVAAMPRLIGGGHTAIGSALMFAAREIETNRFDGSRWVIDVAGDGRNNAGPPLRAARREVLAKGITINGLAILNELPLLDRYFRDHLIGGDSAFHLVANDFEAFADAMTEKLLRETELAPVSDNRPMVFPRRGKSRILADAHPSNP